MTKEMINNINKAIREVITTQFKKDAKESHELLENLGYKIYKYDGSFWVKNPKNDKTIGMGNYGRLIYGRNSVYTRYYKNREQEYDNHLNYFNFYNCLEVAPNKNWCRTYHRGGCSWYTDKNDIQIRFENNKRDLNNALWSARHYTKEVEDVQKKLTETIEKLQKELVRVTEYKIEAQLKLKEIKNNIKLAR